VTSKTGSARTDAGLSPFPPARAVPVVVIGAGQAGLSAAYHLRRRGVAFMILDAEDGPGGAWRHRWRSLRMGTVNGIFDLPGMPKPAVDAAAPAADAIPRYFAAYEREFGFGVQRPVRVLAVRDEVPGDSGGRLLVETTGGTWVTRAVINATGTWTAPNRPAYPGSETFAGRQLHVAEYVGAQEFAGRHVVVVGGGISAVQLLDEISRVATTTWVTRREPTWIEGAFTPETTGRQVVARVEADARAGRPIGSIVSYTGLAWTPYAVAARERGALVRYPMFSAIEPGGVRMADGTFQPADVILWATGFTQAVGHLAPLGLRGEHGGIALDGTAAAADGRVHLIGYGPSQSTVGANRAGRAAASAVARWVLADARSSPVPVDAGLFPLAAIRGI
jgi:Pyridine nucleotide-disulphide oxidoreductase